MVKTEDRRGEDGWRRWVRGVQDTTRQRSTCSRPQSYPLNVITCIAVKEAARRPPMYRIGSYLYVFRPCHPPGEPRRLDTWSECTADVLSARLGPDGISREYRRGRSRIPLSRRYLRNVAQCTVERPSKRPSSYMPKLSNVLKARENNTASHAQFFGVLHVGGNRSISKSTSREVASYEACAGASAAV